MRPISRFPHLLLALIVLGPPTLRLGREASTAFEAPLSSLDPTYIFHLGVWSVAAIVSGGLFLTNRDFRKWAFGLAKKQPLSLYACFVLLALISTLYSTYPPYTLFFSGKLLTLLFTTLVVAWLSRNPAEGVLRLLFVTSGVGVLLILILYLVSPGLVGGVGLYGYRLTGGFLGDYGSFALLTLVGALSAIAHGEPRSRGGILPWVAVVVAWVVLIMSQTRSTILPGFAISILLLLFSRRPLVRVSLVFLAAAALMLASSFAEGALAFLMRGQDWAGLATLSGRTVVFDFLVLQWRAHPLLGMGFEAGSRIWTTAFYAETGTAMGSAHDALSKALVDLGAVGAVVLGATLVGAWATIFRSPRPWGIRHWRLLCIIMWVTISSVTSGGIAQVNPTFSMAIVALAAARATVGATAGYSPRVLSGTPAEATAHHPE